MKKNLLGIDTSISIFFISKLFSFLSAPISIYLISKKLSVFEQGYYFTFSSLLGISVFFELGLGVVITQFASHEFSKLNWTKEGDLIGDNVAKSNLIYLVKKSLFWYFIMSIIMALVMIPIGLSIFKEKAPTVTLNYVYPWILLILAFSVNTALIPFISMIEGCNRVSDVQKLRLFQTTLVIPTTWLFLYFNIKLYVFFIEYFGYFIVTFIWIFFRYKKIFFQIFKTSIPQNSSLISWKNDVFPMQWRIAISWLSAYFINYMFVPLLFHYSNSIEAAKMGMSLKLTGYIYIFSMAWVNTKTPLYGSLISNKNEKKLRYIFKSSTYYSVTIAFISSFALLIFVYFYEIYNPKFTQRILPLNLLALLCIANIINVFNSSIAGYLRAFKKEPLLLTSLILAFLIAISNIISAKYYNVSFMIVSYLAILILVGVRLHLYTYQNSEKRRIYGI
jgi:hypothetical protein